MSLTDTAARNAKPQSKPYKLFDEKGLFLLVTPAGGKWWRLKYRIDHKEKLLSLGVYPDTPVKRAREKRDEYRRLLADGIDPSAHRQATSAARAEKLANSFEVVAREWISKRSPEWATQYTQRVVGRFENDVFPWIGTKPIAEVGARELLDIARRVETRGANETARRILALCGQVFRYAVATARATRDPTPDLRDALPSVKGKHFAAITEPVRVGELLRQIDGYQGSLVVQSALKFAPLVFVRPGELRNARWEDIDLDTAEWRYTVTKTNTQHIVPLAKQAVAILRELQLLTGSGKYVFPSARSNSRPMCDNAVLAAFRRMGIAKDEMSGHGFRAMARTILDEVLGVRPDFIEHQLAHSVKDPNGRAYNRTAHLPERRKMMQQWADYLDKLKSGAEIIPLHQSA